MRRNGARGVIEFLNRHGLELMVLNYVYNSAVQALPAIDEHCGRLYVFGYRFLHGLAGNWGLATRPAA
jgi:hypothetical protein